MELTKDSHIIKLFAYDLYYKNHVIIGTDEAGRGPAAGGVFASAVCFQERSRALIEKLSVLNDSKQLSKKKRDILYDIILNETINATVCIDVKEIEEINILNASLKAMKLAVEDVLKRASLAEALEGNLSKFLVLVDGNKMIKDFNMCSQKWVVKGDAKSASIAAASILAKVSRDRYMQELDAKYPQYGWAKNAGYLTQEHLAAIDKYGLTEYHRPSFLRKHFSKQEQLSMF
ncbi:TPA: ribonuclease HII [Candidatus Scatousia excrementigallinarum]|uniref:Ribonuclease n=1 Tax=Candidatus Scatousia excrementigallinarum TaxID=2840935 RepID=A0A9D1JMC3_9BACT|nr:ribonuclease HII [Candidatus Scatousia excrementigallinarum]